MLRLIALVVAAVLGLTTSPQAERTIDAHAYANQTPYGDPLISPIVQPPDGYDLFFLQTVGRHGARTLTTPGTEARALALWADAASEDAVTPRGERFAADVEEFREDEQSLGYGNLSTIGKAEWAGIGRRTADSYRDFLRQASEDGDHIEVKTSPVLRTKDSASAMRSAITEELGDVQFSPPVTDSETLLIANDASPRGRAATEAAHHSPGVRRAARHLLGRLYDADFVAGLGDPVGEALVVHLLYSTAAGLAADTDVTFEEYVPLEDARALAYARDAITFYRYGPGVAGETSTFEDAEPLLEDFFTELERRIDGGSAAAVFRLAHGETTMPFAALIGAPGSRSQTTEGVPYTYEGNPWRGYVAGRLAGSLEWAAYRDDAGNVLVTMRQNELPAGFREGCRPLAPYLYDLHELRRCLG